MRLEPHEVRRVAVESETSPPTVERFLSGRRVRALSERRITRALAVLGFETRRPRRARRSGVPQPA